VAGISKPPRVGLLVEASLVVGVLVFIAVLWSLPGPTGPLWFWPASDLRCYEATAGFALRTHRLAYTFLALLGLCVVALVAAIARKSTAIGCIGLIAALPLALGTYLAFDQEDWRCGN
jgi:hypothetical protein